MIEVGEAVTRLSRNNAHATGRCTLRTVVLAVSLSYITLFTMFAATSPCTLGRKHPYKRRKQNKKQNLNTKPKNRTNFAHWRGNKEVVQTKQTREHQNQSIIKQNNVNGRGGATALMMHHRAAVEASPSPNRRGECAHTTSQPYP